MSKLPVVNGKEAIKALKMFGFYEARQKGSHHILKKEGHEAVVTVPVHGTDNLKKGTLKGIIESAGITVDEFIAAI